MGVVGFLFVFNIVVLLLVALAALMPFIHMAAVSLSSAEYVVRNQVGFWAKGFQLNVYSEVLNDKRLLAGYKNTIVYMLLGTALSLAFTPMGAYSLSKRELTFGKPIMLLIVFTKLFSGGMISAYLVVRSYGIMNTVWVMVLPGLISTRNLIVMRTFLNIAHSRFVSVYPEAFCSRCVDQIGQRLAVTYERGWLDSKCWD